MAITRIGNPAIADQRGVNFRNIIINGDMSIAQRGTSATNVSTGYHTCDRWRVSRGAGTLDVSQETDAPTGSGFVKSFKFLENGSGANPGASDRNFLQHRIEGQNVQYLKKGTSSAQQLTLSFWIKATVTGTYIAELFDNDNSRQVSKAYTVSSANTWEYKTITFPADTTGTFDNDNGSSLHLNLYLTAGTNYTSGTLNTTWNTSTQANRAVGQVNALASANDLVQFTGVQLEAGQVASDFEFLPYDVNIIRCKRYFQILGPDGAGNVQNAFVGFYNTTTQLIGVYTFPVRMRVGPSQTFSAVSDWDLEPFDVAPTALSTFGSRPDQISISATDPSARVRGYGGAICMDTSGGYVQMSAEL